MINMVDEIFGCESVSQVTGHVAQTLEQFEDISKLVIIYVIVIMIILVL